jgi:signal transduction histidine kinase/predicted RNA-binding protein with RPS1 domain
MPKGDLPMVSHSDTDPYVSVRVQRLLPFGLLVSLKDGQLGIIREREISWYHYDREHWRQRFKAGDELQAVLLGEGHDQRLELSLRLAENDPWIDLHTRYQLGQIVQGEVSGVQPYGTFIEIEPGVTGLLHETRLPVWARSQSLEDLFWPGDRVKVAIERIDPRRRHIGLSLARAWEQRWQSAKLMAPIAPCEGAYPADSAREPISALAQRPLPTWTVLVIEDDPVQLEAIARWLRQARQRTLVASSAEEALLHIEREPPDLVLTDFSLPGINGVQALQQIQARWPTIHCALMTDWACASEHMEVIDALMSNGSQLLIKPLLPADIAGLLTEYVEEQEASQEQAPSAKIAMPAATELLHAQQPRNRLLKGLLARLGMATGASKTLIFQLDPAQRKVRILAEDGATVLNADATVDLIHSPVRDVAEDQQVFRLEDAQEVEPRLRYLRPLLAFRSCLGLCIPNHLPDHYALFLFSPQQHAFTAVHEQYAVATALAAGALLDRDQFQTLAMQMQRLALLGQLSRALVHELNHQISPINFALSDIVEQIDTIGRRPAQAPDEIQRDLGDLQATLQDLVKSVRNLTGTARMFGRVTIQTREQLTHLDGIVQEVVHLVRDMAERAHVRVDLDTIDMLPAVRVQSVQLQQLLLNIVINAIQQINLVRPTEGGRTRIQMTQTVDHVHAMLKISIEDDGPGIHRQLWSHIFDLGFTTRTEGGSGLGLYITRSLAEALGGQVYVAESYMLWGSTFVVELPVA